MVMVPIPMPMEDRGHTATAILMPTATTERDLLMPSLRPIPPSSTPPIVPIPMLTLDSITATLDTTLDTLMPTMERGPPMLSPRLMPMPTTDITDTPGPMVMATATVATGDTTGDKSSLRVPSKSSTRTSLLVNLTFHPSVRLLGGVGN